MLCQYCYNPDDHIDHQVTVHISPRDLGGVCDCGDPEAWVTHFSCKHHNADNFAEDPVPQEFVEALKSAASIALDYAIDVFAMADSGIQLFTRPEQVLENEELSELDAEKYGVQRDVDPNGSYVLSLWNDQKHSFEDAFNVIKQVTHKDRQFAKMITYQVDGEGRAIVAVDNDLDRLMRQKPLMERTGLVTTVRGCRELFREESAAAVIGWICDLSRSYLKQNYKVMRDVISQALFEPWQCPNPETYNWAPASDHLTRFSPFIYGRLDGYLIPDLNCRERIPESASAYERTFRHVFLGEDDEETEGIHERGLLDDDDLEGMDQQDQDEYTDEGHDDSQGDSGHGSSKYEDASDSYTGAEDGSGVSISDDDSENLDKVPDFDPHFDPWKEEKDNVAINLRIKGENGQFIPNARVQYLIFFDIRLWKSLRLLLRDVYIAALVSNQESKLQLGRYYGQIYPQVAELYMLADREPECSILSSLSTQLFTTPSIATDLVKCRYVNNFVAALYRFFTSGVVGKPKDCDVQDGIADERVLKNRRFGQLFHDLEYLLNRNSQHELVACDPITTAQFSEFFLLFQGVSPMQRKVDEHVEYESESWIYYFNSMPYVLQLAVVAAQGISKCSNAGEAVATVTYRLLEFANDSYAGRLKQSESCKPNWTSYSWRFGDYVHTIRLPKFAVETQPVSLHHPLHIYLSWLIENAHFKDRDELKNAILHGCGPSREVESLLLIFEHPIRVLSLLCQIQVGLWVRNGFSVRSQLHYYREQTMRDPAFDRDIFMAQTSLVVQDPSIAMAQLLTRFSLNNWRTDKLFDDSQRAYTLESFLHHLIGFLMETTRLQGLDVQEVKKRRIEREIIQALAFQDMSFSEMCRHIPDQLTNDELLETQLRSMCTFKPPSGVRDYGSYSLKPEYYSQFDTHYIHFSAARIEEAEAIIKSRFKEEVHEPPVQNVEGLFANIASFALTLPFAKLMWDVLDFVSVSEGQDALLGHALQLLHVICLKTVTKVEEQQCENICQLVQLPHEGKSIVEKLTSIKTMKMYAKHLPKINRVFELLRQIDPTNSTQIGLSNADLTQEDDEQLKRTEEKRKLGQQRKAMIMAEFQRKQQLFAQSLNEEDMDIDVDDDGDQSNEWVFPESECIFCRMPDEKDTIFGVMAYVVTSNVERMVPFDDPHWVTEAFRGFGKEGDSRLTENPSQIGPGFPIRNSRRSCVVTGCGHGMHYHCYEEYIKTSLNRGQQLTRNNPEDSEKGEFLCPLCRALNNMFIPILWKRTGRTMDNFVRSNDNKVLREMCNRLDEYSEVVRNGSETADIHVIRPQLAKEGTKSMLSHYVEVLENSGSDVSSALYKVLSKAGQQVTNHMRNMNLDPSNQLYLIRSNVVDMNSIVHCLASSISTFEISLRNDSEGITDLPQQIVQTLKVFAEYCKSTVLSSQVETGSVFNVNIVHPLAEYSKFLFDDFMACCMITAPALNLKVHHVIRTFYAKAIRQTLDQLYFQLERKQEWAVQYRDISTKIQMPKLPNDNVLESLAEYFKSSGWEFAIERDLLCFIYTLLRKSTFAFMRKIAIFAFLLTGDISNLSDCTDLYDLDAITDFLQVESFDQALLTLGDTSNDGNSLSIVYQRLSLLKANYGIAIEFPSVVRLLHLPHRLDEFFNIRNYATDHGHQMETLADPGVCLFCGASVGMQTPAYSTDDSKGQCFAHMTNCGRDIGIFLLPKRSCILLMKGRQGSFIEGPYLDLHGEVDETMRRGRPQFLQNNRYDYFTRNCWQQHGIANYIARRLDSAVDNGGWETL